MALTSREVKQLCGRFSYERGQAALQGGQVILHRVEQPDVGDETKLAYSATVQSSQRYDVVVELSGQGRVPDVNASCTCPSLASYSQLCSHIAAVLLAIVELTKSGTVPQPQEEKNAASAAVPRPAQGKPLDEKLLSLFLPEAPTLGARAASYGEERPLLEIEYVCRPLPYGIPEPEWLIGVELNVGSGKRHPVADIREFLKRCERGERYAFARGAEFDPARHALSPRDDEIVRLLARISSHERTALAAAPVIQTRVKSGSSERTLPIPPVYWESLQPLLAAAEHARLATEHSGEGKLAVSDRPVPLRFELGEAEDGEYALRAAGLDRLLVLKAYGLAIADGELCRIPAAECRQLAELKKLLGDEHGSGSAGSGERLPISAARIGAFVEHAAPGLMRLGTVVIDPVLSEKLTRRPLRAKLFLDRVRDRLLAGLEFHYGDIVVHPLEADERRHRSDRILIREGEKEQAILRIMNAGGFYKTEGGYVMADEDAEYEFLYHKLPELEKLAQVYATTAVKLRLHSGPSPVVVTVQTEERMDWLEFRFDLDGIRDSELKEIVKALQEKRKYYRLPEGTLLSLESPSFLEVMRLLDEAAIRKNEWYNSRARVPLSRALLLTGALDREKSDAVRFAKSVRKLLENMRNPDHLDHEVPESLSPILRDYQKYGYQWMKTLAHYRFGGILADEMGLGKTLQSIAYLVSELPGIRASAQPALIVCPASLVYNWLSELRRFAPEVRAAVVDGAEADRTAVWRSVERRAAAEAAPDVLITSYPLLRKDIRRLRPLAFHTLLLDEAQNVKNEATQTAKAVKSLAAPRRFALTGTPIENRLAELWSICDAVFPELFGDKNRFFELPPGEVSRRIRPFLLRRRKNDVLRDLPDKLESDRLSELLPEQKKLYVAYLAELRAEAVKHLKDKDHRPNRIRILAGLTRLRQLICHPALFVEGYKGGSAKLEQLLELIDEGLASGRRILVFSQFTTMLDLIGKELVYRGLPYFRLDGETPPADRVEMSERFNAGELSLFLVSLKAGGTGLNLTGADTVILYDLWWNPAVEAQAADRAHRIGQRKVVQVIRMVARGTIEERMTELQRRKLDLIDEVLEPGAGESLAALTEEELQELLRHD
ncbi:DEAD/DEAH box helicase [Cohnella fermenti]|uniref:Helicase SNF n=1 Tax=Cohnella fermenti TaxID=2565925 RepID=A0A4S4BYB1_9BACL|nr:DEAD/DEAH box helicase [Cohnella fermenti]THF79532.1 helicase SNF [Cohnella fermenti]